MEILKRSNNAWWLRWWMVVNGILVPAGSTTVYDQVLGKNAKRPFLHVRYRASETEDRRYKTWITGSAGGAATSELRCNGGKLLV